MQTTLFPVIVIFSVILGGVVGQFGKAFIPYIKPFGEIFLNLIFTAIVPLIFFSVSSAIAKARTDNKLSQLFVNMFAVFTITSLVAAVFALLVVKIFPPGTDINLAISTQDMLTQPSFINQITTILTVPNFAGLLSHEHILALIFFSALVGVSASNSKDKGRSFISFLESGEIIFMNVFKLIMFMAPLGFFSYFAVLVNDIGPQIIGSYLRIGLLYYAACLFYFVVALTMYAYLSGKLPAVKLFWSHVFLPTITSLATCSSAASIPANLSAAQSMAVPAYIYETSIPLGSIIHKDGSVIGGMFKIAFLFGIFHLNFATPSILITALGVSLLVGTVMGAIPSGGMLGELLILNFYGFPPSSLVAIAVFSIIIDPIATMINVTSNAACGLLIPRLIEGKNWWYKGVEGNSGALN